MTHQKENQVETKVVGRVFWSSEKPIKFNSSYSICI